MTTIVVKKTVVTVHHILYENVQIIILFTHQPCQIDAQNLVDLADIYQDIKDFIFVFQLGLNETMNDSLAICQENFGLLWGQKLVNTLRALHDVKYNQQNENDEEDNEEENNELSDDDYCCEEDGCHCHDDECHCHEDGCHCRNDE